MSYRNMSMILLYFVNLKQASRYSSSFLNDNQCYLKRKIQKCLYSVQKTDHLFLKCNNMVSSIG